MFTFDNTFTQLIYSTNKSGMPKVTTYIIGSAGIPKGKQLMLLRPMMNEWREGPTRVRPNLSCHRRIISETCIM